MNIDVNTRFITLIGTPLDQSFAARMQNAGYRAGGFNLCYFYTEADDAHLAEIMQGIRYMPSFTGCAVTKPNKVSVLPYLDELDPLCAKMGACNTVVKRDGKLIGYNTDGIGFLRAIDEETDLDIPSNRFFCFGAGGAGRAICSALAHRGAQKIYLTDLYPESARRLADDINGHFAPIAEAVPYGDYTRLADCTVVINASGVGMGATVGQTPLPEEQIRPEQFYFDACYNPDRTQFLLNAQAHGCKILNGLGMSLYQGVVQVELWTGKPAPVEAMRGELAAILKEKAWAAAHADDETFCKKGGKR